MNSQPVRPQDSLSPNEMEVRALYRQLLDGWKSLFFRIPRLSFMADRTWSKN